MPVLASLIWVCALTAQAVIGTQVPAPRDRPPVPATGSGVIKGRIVDGVSGAAVPRARVRIMGNGGQRPSVVTDAAGAFVFKNLPPGPFTFSVEKSTYLPGRYPATGRTLRAFGKPVLLQAGETLDSLAIPLFHGGAITGRVLDGGGDVVEGAEVQLLRVSGSGKPTTGRGGGTNDLGDYRFGKLEPGTYLVMARSRRFGMEEPLAPNTDPPPQPVPSYYPGVTSIDTAQPIRVERGQTHADIDVTLIEAVPAVVSGTVVAEDGQPPTNGGFIMVRATVKEMPSSPFDVGGTAFRQDGTFRLMLPPGEYTLEARPNTPGSGATPQDRVGMLRVSVGGNLEGLTIPLGRGASASGRIVFEGGSPLPASPALMQVPLFAQGGMTCRQGRMTIAPDWTFTVEGLFGTCSAPPFASFGSWTTKSLQINGEEFEEQSITFEPGQRLSNVQVVLTDRRSGVTFRVADESGQATREYVAIVFPVSKGPVLPGSIRTLVPPTDEIVAFSLAMNPGRPANPRRETITPLRPGDYYAIAIDDIAADDVRDPSLMLRLTSSATRVTLGDVPDTQISLTRQKLADILKR